MVDDNEIDIQMLQLSNSTNGDTFINITGLNDSTCYIFGVRAYIDNGYSKWRVIANETLSEPPPPTTTATSPTLATSRSSIGVVIGVTFSILLLIVAAGAVFGVVVFIRFKRLKYAQIKKEESGNNEIELLSANKKDSSDHSCTTGLDDTDTNNENNPIQIESVYSAVHNEDIIPPVYEPTYTDIDTLKVSPPTVYNTPKFDPKIPLTLPVSVDELGTHVATCHSNGFDEQYENLSNPHSKRCTIGHRDENSGFNRFKNITVYDDNRIILKPNPNLDMCEREYINASYIDGYSSSNKFIASQGPMKKTLVDFWRLIWQEKPVSIVMVTNLKEGTKSKCEQYWPNKSEEFGPFTVMLISQQVYPDFVIRQLNVKIQDGSNDSHTLTQYHLTSWPDHGVPDYATPLMSLHKQVMATWSPSKGPILVHCSAGVGRTGTFIAIDIALEQAKREGVVDIAGIVNRLRQQRMKMVQTLDQYVFLHDAVLEAIICGETKIPTDKYQTKLQELKEIDSSTGCSGLQSQFDLLSQVTPDPDDVFTNTAKAYPAKNRSSKFLPVELFLVPLQEANGYINASFISGFHEKRAFIIAQSPMENTARDLTDWPQDGVVREPRTVLQVIDDVIHRQQKIGGGPVVVHCSDTVSRSGVYCSVSIGLEQCKAEGVVDVFQVTKAVRRSKPGAVTTLEQYTSIYDVIDMYLQMNSMYGNFSV
ncbi:PREDICTED: receptor-type tyrosine-protein phosphatase S-like [Amphimedon queenslandica]|uniref:protein-tyrosine-phosphatase n=1 Tax=Amphimedon queenslandica TaxID=400682 RepID=A0AAN0JMW1_AMPQE|nr:PREDICTED: receptor-type tyrosine-protein phosphatase S-like [Amphimedon queenslandica]|eukprot:XP_019858334.1 PREDICTED: receptor-type tyrosine-protein phosphatase S-like [Amphimedon queenslandica]